MKRQRRPFRIGLRRLLAGFLLAALIGGGTAPAAESGALSEDAVKAALIYNFAKFIEWPPKAFADPKSPINLCIYRDNSSDLRQALSAFQGKQVQGHEILVRAGILQKDIGTCQVLFIPESQERWLPDVLRAAHAQNVLTVSDLDDFVDAGGIIELLHLDGQQRFAINLDAAQRANLKISAQLLKLARSVKGQAGKL